MTWASTPSPGSRGPGPAGHGASLGAHPFGERLCQPRASPGLRGLEEAGGGLAGRIVVPDVLEDVHFVHGLNLLLLLPRPRYGLWWARWVGHGWLSGKCWLNGHWRLGLGLGLGCGFSPQVQNLVQVLFNSREPEGKL